MPIRPTTGWSTTWTDDGTTNEDDHDIAEITVPTFDLALRKTVDEDIVSR